MKTIRIPIRYKKQLNRLPEKEQVYILSSLLSMASGEDVEQKDSMAGDILEAIWEECKTMERKNAKSDLNDVGGLLAGIPRVSRSLSKEVSKVSKEVKENKKKKFLDYVFLTEKEYKKLLIDFGESKLRMCIEKLDNAIPNSKAAKSYKDHNRVLRGWVSKWFDELPEKDKPKKNISEMTAEEIFNNI